MVLRGRRGPGLLRRLLVVPAGAAGTGAACVAASEAAEAALGAAAKAAGDADEDGEEDEGGDDDGDDDGIFAVGFGHAGVPGGEGVLRVVGGAGDVPCAEEEEGGRQRVGCVG